MKYIYFFLTLLSVLACDVRSGLPCLPLFGLPRVPLGNPKAQNNLKANVVFQHFPKTLGGLQRDCGPPKGSPWAAHFVMGNRWGSQGRPKSLNTPLWSPLGPPGAVKPQNCIAQLLKDLKMKNCLLYLPQTLFWKSGCVPHGKHYF